MNLLDVNEGVALGLGDGGLDGVELGVAYFLTILNKPGLTFLPSRGMMFMVQKSTGKITLKRFKKQETTTMYSTVVDGRSTTR